MHVSIRWVVDDMHALIAYGTLYNFTSMFAINIHADIHVNAISFALVTTFFLPASTVALQQGNAISVCDMLLRSHMVCPFTTAYFLVLTECLSLIL